jgi:hypothetical protein
MTVKAHSGWRRMIAGAAVLGLVFQAALSAFMMPMSPARAAMAASRGAGFPVCTPLGFKWLPPRTDGGGQDEQPAGREDCAICAALAASAFASLPVVHPVPALELQTPRTVPSRAGHCQPGATVLTHHNRGPPRFA